jgi:hypothetical protein
MFFTSFGIAIALVNCIHNFAITNSQRITSKIRSPFFLKRGNFARICWEKLHFLIKTEHETFIIFLIAAVIFPLNMKVSTGSLPLGRLKERYSLATADASSLPIGKLPSVDR